MEELRMDNYYFFKDAPYYDRTLQTWAIADIEFDKDTPVGLSHSLDPVTCRYGSDIVSKSMPESVFTKYGHRDKKWYRYIITDDLMMPLPKCRLVYTIHAKHSEITVLDAWDKPPGSYQKPIIVNKQDYGSKTKCPKCGSPSYEGFNSVQCSNGCELEY